MPRVPKTLKLHEAQGTKSRAAKTSTAGNEMPTKPKFLSKVASTEWDRITKLLMASGSIRRVDRALLAAYAETYAHLQAAEEKRRHDGDYLPGSHGGTVIAPWVKVARDERTLLLQLARELGLTPHSRRRLNIDDKPNPAKSAIEKFINRKKS